VLLNLAAPALAGEREAFVAAYRCRVAEALEALRAPDADGSKSYVVLARRDLAQSFVQCLQNAPTSISCEASTGYAGPRLFEAGSFRLANDQRQALERLGFAWHLGSLNLVLEIGEPLPTSEQLATLLLAAQFDGYGSRLGQRLVMTAPLQRERPAVLVECPAEQRLSTSHPQGYPQPVHSSR
jgi:hypothetical protein